MASNLSKLEIVNNVLDIKIQNIEPKFREYMFNILFNLQTVTSVAACREIVYQQFIPKTRLSKKSKQYWIDRGWTSNESYVKSKENKPKNCKSVYSKEFWLEKINPATNTYYTVDETDFERNSRRPIRKEYWIKKGYSEGKSIQLANEAKEKNNKKGSKNSVITPFRSVSSRRCIEYYTARGFSTEEAEKLRSNSQKYFSKEICIQKHGESNGTKIWQSRQDAWQATLNAKPAEEKARINRSKLSKGITVSKAEKIITEKLVNLGFEVITQFSIFHENKKQFVYDIMYNNKIIEYNGDFWHSNPAFFKEDYWNPKTKITAGDKWKLDKIKIQAAQDQGYEVLVIWENDFKKSQTETIDKCIQFLTQ